MQHSYRLITVVDTYPCLSETFIEREVLELRRQGVAVDIAALRGKRPWRLPQRPAAALRLAVLRGHFHRPRHCLSLLRCTGQAAALSGCLRDGPPALLLAQFAWTPADVCRLAAACAGVPFLVRAHARDVFAQAPPALRRRLAGAAGVLPCNAAAGDAVRACGYPSERITLVHHGLPLHDEDWRWQAPEESRRVVGIGRLVPKKGVEVLLAAAARLTRAGVPFDLEWIGCGPEARRLRRLAAAPELRGRVSFAGALPPDAARERLRSAALLVLPSVRLADGDRDGIANVLLEAMALGVPVLTTTAGAAGEVLADGVNGLLVPPGDAAALAAAMRRALESLPLRRALACAARATVEREFDLGRNAAALRVALEAAVAADPP